ncbi:MAG: AI-2E family transporter [Solirubrobacterales bacterium]|nr:AI-2E family transporter [Solirubrobacterales bacterium]
MPRGAEGEARGGDGVHDTRDLGDDGEGPPTNGGAESPPGARAATAAAKSSPKPPPVIVPRWVQLVVLPIALLGLWALARASGTVLLILITASIIALIINPLVKVLERRRLPRGLAIFVVYLGFFAILAGIGLLLSNPISTQVTRFQRDVPQLVSHANKDLASFQQWLNRHGIRIHIQQQGQTALQTLQKNVLKRSGAIVSFSRDLLTQIVTIGFDLVLILVLSIYLLVYGRQIGDLVRKIMPAGDGTPEDDYPLLVQQAVFGYVRGQVLFSLIMGASASLALWILGVVGIFPAGADYGIFFGAFYGLMEFIPYIGPIIGPAPAVLVALFNNPISAVWVVLLFVALQQLEGHLVAPQVFRISLRINPIVIILSLLIGYQIYGIVGALVALPVAAVVRQTVVYLRRHLVLEQWSLVSPGVGVPPAGSVISGEHPRSPSVVTPLDSERCAECGADTQAEDSFCRTCGAPLAPRVRTPG